MIAAAIMTVLFLGWILTAFQLFYDVTTTAPKRADAVVMLGGASKERMLDAMMIRFDLEAPYLVLSNTDTKGNASADNYCDTHSNKKIYPEVVCFDPNPMDTRGEAVALAELAAEHQWKDMVVVTSSYHIERAGLLMEQCINANVTMMSTTPQFTVWQWFRRFVIETGGLIDVTLNPECESSSGN